MVTATTTTQVINLIVYMVMAAATKSTLMTDPCDKAATRALFSIVSVQDEDCCAVYRDCDAAGHCASGGSPSWLVSA